MKLQSLTCLCAALVLCGCASTEKLRQERDVLAAELSVARDKITDLEGEKQGLEAEVTFLTKVGQVLEQEKDVRVQETAEVRSEARKFVQSQVAALRDFSQARELLDYVGGELIDRANLEGQGLLLVDMDNPVPGDGTLVGSKLFARGAMKVSICVLRRQGQNLVLLWQSREFDVPNKGVYRLAFKVPIAVEKGDLVGLHSPQVLQVPYDVGLGDTRIFQLKPSVGSSIPLNSSTTREKRSYSFGATGFVE